MGRSVLVTLFSLSVVVSSSACVMDNPAYDGPDDLADAETGEHDTKPGDGDGDGEQTGSGDGDDTNPGDGDGTDPGDGDGDGTNPGDGDGDDTNTGDGDGDDTNTGDGDGDACEGILPLDDCLLCVGKNCCETNVGMCLEDEGCTCMIKCLSLGIPFPACELDCIPGPALAAVAAGIADCIGNACADVCGG